MDTRNEIREGCFNLGLRRAAREVTRAYDHAFAEVGLTSGQFSILAMLSEEPVPAIGEIAETMAMDRTTLLAALKPLERRGLIQSEVDDSDKRRRPLVLTSEGRAIFERALPVWLNAQTELAARYGADRIQKLRDALSS